jgi:hypothetical protein
MFTPSEPRGIPLDVRSRDFAEWIANEYHLAMAKGATLAIEELGGVAEIARLKKRVQELEDHLQMQIDRRDPFIND